MAKITRMGSNKILSSSVEYHNFVFLAGMTADDLSLDIIGQTKQVLAKIDASLDELTKERECVGHLIGQANPVCRIDKNEPDTWLPGER